MSDTPEQVPPTNDATVNRLATAITQVYAKPGTLMWRSFLSGFMTALGATVGTALFFTILVWVFQRLGGVDLIKPEIEKLQNIIIPQKFQDQITGKTSLNIFLERNNLRLG